MDRYKATSENLRNFYSGKQPDAVKADQKIYSLLIYNFCSVVKIFKVTTSLSIFSTTWPSLAQQKTNENYKVW